MSVSAVIVNYNAGDLLGECVQSLLDNQVRDIRVVDNASDDGSLDRLRGRYGAHPAVHTLANPTNLGFGPAINAVLPSLGGDLVLIMNPDCRLEQGALAILVDVLQTQPKTVLVGPRVEGPDGRLEAAACRRIPTPWRSLMTLTGLSRLAGRFPSLAGVTEPGADGLDSPTTAEATSGACMLARSDALQAIGGFDEAYSLHCEDLDLMVRLREAGGRILYVPAARAVHIKGVSSASRPLWVHRQKHRGMARFFRTHVADAHALPVRLLVRLGIWLHWALLWPLQWVRR